MKTRKMTGLVRLASAACAALMAALLAAPARAAERPTDKDVKQLIEQINHERDRFEDQRDGKLKRSIIRGPGAEVTVGRYLDDLQDNVNKLKDRFTSQYAASAEETTVLRQGFRHPALHGDAAAQLRRRQRVEPSVGEPRPAGRRLRDDVSDRR